MAIEPETTAERKKLAETLELMRRQDPTFRAEENEETGQTLISGMGELHLEVIRNRLLRDFRLNVKVHKPRVSYRETIEQRDRRHAGSCHRQMGGPASVRRNPGCGWSRIRKGRKPVTVTSRCPPGRPAR